jgi:hypothetical protein
MQFGKFHAWAFIAFGTLLVLVQLALFFSPKKDVVADNPPPVAAHTSPLPGIVGLIALGIGITFYIKNRNRPQE